ncbi:7-methylguanosine phosphate-specific 5'-nucleotidase [Varanus komodoensis]|nr:7-methylguanosine phosphate-specific 5'-nucleotidase [Varanus komodoensis]
MPKYSIAMFILPLQLAAVMKPLGCKPAVLSKIKHCLDDLIERPVISSQQAANSTPGGREGDPRCLLLAGVPELEKATVQMKNPEQVQNIISMLRKGGAERLQVISDFDMTLTRFGFNGQRCPTSHNIIDNSRVISDEGKKKFKVLGFNLSGCQQYGTRFLKDLLYPIESAWAVRSTLVILLSVRKIQQCDLSMVTPCLC